LPSATTPTDWQLPIGEREVVEIRHAAEKADAEFESLLLGGVEWRLSSLSRFNKQLDGESMPLAIGHDRTQTALDTFPRWDFVVSNRRD
jgi:hypothetical protein